MAREHQGLQIALIVFVMLTIVLGVTTFIFYGRYDEALVRAKAEIDKTAQARAKIDLLDGDCKKLKIMIGVAQEEPVAQVETIFKADMEKFAGKPEQAGALPDDQRFYRPLVEQLFTTINARDKQLLVKQEEIRKVEQDRDDNTKRLESQIEKYKAEALAANEDLKKEKETFAGERGRMTDDKSKLASQVDKSFKDSQVEIKKKKDENESLVKKNVELIRKNSGLVEKLDVLTKEEADTPLGEIRWVDLAAGKVWINLGRADSLPRQINFSVYSPNATDVSKAGRKASIEVTQITKEKEAECRILEDKISDPIMPGDKIFTPIWRPGDKKHFALAGLMDLNGDGKSDLQAVKNLITMNGGVIDCEPSERGDERIGEMTANTRYLVLGAEPRGEAGINVWSKMDGDAKRLGVKKISLEDLLAQMGYKNQAPLTQFGGSKGGPVSSPYKPRNPPGVGSGR